MLADWAPVLATLGALVAAFLAYLSSRRKPAVDEQTANKIKTEIQREQQTAASEKALADAKRDRHITRLENWGFQLVRPWGRLATSIIEEQNDVLVKLCGQSSIPFTPRHLDPMPEMPQFTDE